MTENSTAGLTMLDAERAVGVVGDEHYQDLLWEYLPEPGRSPRVAIELVPVGPRLEARLDGRRVGELTALMSLRYALTVDGVLRRGERPGCVGRIVHGKRGFEMELQLPAVNAAGGPPTEQLPVIAPSPRSRPRSRRPLWVGIGVVAVLVVIGAVVGASRNGASPADAFVVTTRAVPPATVSPPLDDAVDPPTVTPSTSPRRQPVYYKNCGVALALGAAPIRKGQPGYRTGLDPDGDGIACPV